MAALKISPRAQVAVSYGQSELSKLVDDDEAIQLDARQGMKTR
jgi:hypothetical protein